MMLCACDEPPPNVTFDGARALEYVKLQVTAGPRVPGTDVHRLVGDRIVAELRKTADTVIEQTWIHVTQTGDSLPLRNIFAQFNRAATKRIFYATHWDSRPRATNAFSEDDKKKPVPGANDGASGVGLLLVLAEALKAAPPGVGVDLLFIDGEDYGDFVNLDVDTSRKSDVLIGAKYYANHLLPDPSYRPTFGILWDMIGDRDLLIKRDSYSEVAARDVNDRVWKMAKALGYGRVFVNDVTTVIDDHLPLLGKGLKVIDVIDLEYDAHHKTSDTVDKVSAESLTIVGRVALALIRAEEGK
jgi:glutaminyl-peptide cyclotransferase